MKKILHFALCAVVVALVSCCGQVREWNEEQRADFASMVDDYRQMVYLNELNDAEFTIFADDLSTDVETAYPVYTEFIVMPSVSDTLDMWVVTTIVEDIDADASNMRYLYPYRTLVAQGILPAGLDHTARMSFYSCFADKVDNHYSSLESFFYAVITNSVEPNLISKMQAECAQDLFSYTVVDDTAIEAIEVD